MTSRSALALLGSLSACSRVAADDPTSAPVDADGTPAAPAAPDAPDAAADVASTSSVSGRSGGCGRTGAPTGVANRSIDVAGLARTFVLSVPSSYRADEALPLVFAWHGASWTGSGFRGVGFEKAPGARAIWVYPDGINRAWDTGRSSKDIPFFDAMLAAVSAEYCVDLRRVFSTGHSNGAGFCHTLGCVRAPALRGIAPIAGNTTLTRNCTGPVSLWMTRGRAEGDLFVQAEASRDYWLMVDGCSSTSLPTAPSPPCVTYQGCAAGYLVTWCPHDGGHAPPSFAPVGIWDFIDSLR